MQSRSIRLAQRHSVFIGDSLSSVFIAGKARSFARTSKCLALLVTLVPVNRLWSDRIQGTAIKSELGMDATAQAMLRGACF